MAVRLDVYQTIEDARGSIKLRTFEKVFPKKKIHSVTVVDSYAIDANLKSGEFKKIQSLLANKKSERACRGRFVPSKFQWAIEVGFLPGVTDNIGNTVLETIQDGIGRKLKNGEGVYSSQVFYIDGNLTKKDVEHLTETLYNPLIERAHVLSNTSLKKEKNKVPLVPKVHLKGSSKVLTVDLNVSDRELEEIGVSGIKGSDGKRRGPLALSLPYMKAIREHFKKEGRRPTDIELESLAQTWSEHCKHTIFASPLDEAQKGLYKAYIKRATEEIRARKGSHDFCVSVFSDNSGGIALDDEWVVTHKVETHNSPSALDPFGGAVTGIGGVNRDAMGFGLGAKPVANTYGFCFAEPGDKRKLYRDSKGKVSMLSSKRIMDGVIAGVNAGGNQSGIPTPHGFMIFDQSYRGKPLVFVGTVGLIPKKHEKRKLYQKHAAPGDYIVMAGGKVGLDGIHGATFSSVELSEGSPATSVQIGDPITQKKLSDAIIKEARDLDLYTSITDNGAGGLSSSVGEMAEQSGGCTVDLAKVPLKYPGLEPWQIWISESQERMTLAIPKKKWSKFQKLMEKRGVEATIIGEFTKSGRCIVTYGKKKAMDIDLDFLHHGVPITKLSSKKRELIAQSHVAPLHTKDFSKDALLLLKTHNISSNEFISRQFDHEVQAGSVLKPLQGAGRVNADASVLRPVLSSPRGVVLSSALYPHYAPYDPYAMGAAALDSAVRNAVAAGAPLSHLAILDNFCWPSGNDPERLWQLKETAKACYDLATKYGTPFISGKDSMFNDFKGYDEKGNKVMLSVLPTLLISSIGVMKDASGAVSLDFKMDGDLIYLLGETHSELAGSEYYRMKNVIGGIVPHVDGKKNISLYKSLEKAIKKGFIASSISVGRGGLGVALLRSAMAGEIGVKVSLLGLPGNARSSEAKLFSESQGRILASIDPKNKKEFEALFKPKALKKIGTVTGNTIIVTAADGKRVLKLSIKDALTAYRARFKNE